MTTDHTARLLAAARRVVSANQESQPLEYAYAMDLLERIVAECASPLDTQPVNLETPRMETLLAALMELVREIEANTTKGKQMMMAYDSAVCHVTTFENAKAAIASAEKAAQ